MKTTVSLEVAHQIEVYITNVISIIKGKSKYLFILSICVVVMSNLVNSDLMW